MPIIYKRATVELIYKDKKKDIADRLKRIEAKQAAIEDCLENIFLLFDEIVYGGSLDWGDGDDC